MNSEDSTTNVVSKTFIMPEEGNPHIATWMAYGATEDSWGTNSFYDACRLSARKDVIRIAANLSRFEPVKILINEDDLNEAKMFLTLVKNEIPNVKSNNILLPHIEAAGEIEFIIHPINDLWIRDTGPVFVFDNNKISHGVDFNFNGWGQECTDKMHLKECSIKIAHGIREQRIKEDQEVAKFIIQRTGVKKISTWLIMEGGGVEVNGKGTAICAESCILNPNRNPGKSKEDVEKELFRLLGIKKVIWLPGSKGMDITDGHVDYFARFAGESTVLYTFDNNEHSPDFPVSRENVLILSNATDAFGKKLTIIPLVSPDFKKVERAVYFRNGMHNGRSFFNENIFAAGYIGFYLANNCVLMSIFGDDDADKAAYEIICGIFPERTVMQITTDGIAFGGGTIHCTVQQQI